jgi:hypothetical protein
MSLPETAGRAVLAICACGTCLREVPGPWYTKLNQTVDTTSLVTEPNSRAIRTAGLFFFFFFF